MPLLTPAIAVGVFSFLLVSSTAPALHAASSGTRTYFTSFPSTENPISEGGNWINGGTTGLDWTDARTTTNKTFGTESGIGADKFDDSIAALSGTWGNDQAAQATVFVSSQSPFSAEAELLLRRTITPHFSGGYEFNCSVAPSNPYMFIIRWPGPLGRTLDSFTTVAGRLGIGCVNGDVIGATAIGSTLTMYKNGVPIISGTDTAYSDGSPGVGFFVNNPGTVANFGFTNFAANDNGTLPVLNPTATPKTAPTASATPTTAAVPSATPAPTPVAEPSPTPAPAPARAPAMEAPDSATPEMEAPDSAATPSARQGLTSELSGDAHEIRTW
jgi:hypothetical protein